MGLSYHVQASYGVYPISLVYGQEALQPIELEIPIIIAFANDGKIEDAILADKCVKWVLLDNAQILLSVLSDRL